MAAEVNPDVDDRKMHSAAALTLLSFFIVLDI